MQCDNEGPGFGSVVTFGHVQIEANPGVDLTRTKESDTRVGSRTRFERFEPIAAERLRKERRNGRQDIAQWIDLRLSLGVLMHRMENASRTFIGRPSTDDSRQRLRGKAGGLDQPGPERLEASRYLDLTDRRERVVERVPHWNECCAKTREIGRMEPTKGLFEGIEASEQDRAELGDGETKGSTDVLDDLAVGRFVSPAVGFSHDATVCSRRLECERLIQPTHDRRDRAAVTGGKMILFQRRTSGVCVSFTSVVLLLAFAANSHAQGVPQTKDEKAFYSIGASMAAQLQRANPISESELDVLVQGIRDAVHGKTLAVDQKEGAALVRTMLQEREARAVEIEAVAAAEFLAAEGGKKGAQTTESGLIYTVIKAGNGASPAATDKVRVHYHGTLRDGTVFDSSVERGQPAEFPLNRVIACWTEGVAMMKEGGKSLLICPASIAYGDRSTGRIPAGAALSFEVELIEILK